MTAALQPETKSPSRRALLAGALGGLGALAASAIARPRSVQADDPFDVLLGGENVASDTTTITNNSNNNTVLFGESTSGGIGVKGTSGSNFGVEGNSLTGVGVEGISDSSIGLRGSSTSHIAVHGFSLASGQPATVGWAGVNSTGVLGYSNPGTGLLPAAKAKTGVFGYANQDTTATGVRGESTIGVGVRGKATTGYAGFFDGRVFTTRYYELGEIATPNAPAANQARLFVKDNGAGKTQLCVRFHTGASQIIKTEL